ncbi:uncharacterized protein [Amphiura filiformis]|uniref:uncharacterized protein n=1 Tax=Amphiura filiformis TaxID=82378 RepID=UPI003B221D00
MTDQLRYLVAINAKQPHDIGYACGEGKFRCSLGGECISITYVCDFIPHCLDNSDEEQCEYRSCDHASEFECNNKQCVDVKRRCDLQEDCWDKSDEMFCEIAHDGFQCYDGTWLPSHAFCDGQRDCTGKNWEDEPPYCHNYTCPGGYRCHDDLRCLTPHLLCDGVRHCPDGDDEDFCGTACPDGCVCVGLFYQCNDVTWDSSKAAQIPHDIRQLILTNVNTSENLEGLPAALDQIFGFDIRDFQLLISLDLSSDGIVRLEPGIFSLNMNLRTLILKDNRIVNLLNGTFSGLHSMLYLDISLNILTEIATGAFSELHNLLFLDIRGSKELEPKEEVFSELVRLDTLYSDRYLYCCLTRDLGSVTSCLPEPDQFSSCEDLMRIKALRTFMWLLGVSALLGNGFVIFWRIRPVKAKTRSSNRVQSTLVFNLAIADGLMGVYMIIIASADQYYRNVYIAYAESWQRSYTCKFAGFLSVLSSEASVFFMAVISVDRFVSIAMPFSRMNLTPKSSKITVLLVWLFAGILSIIPVVVRDYFGDEFYGRSSVCLALPLTTEKPAGWHYSVALFLGVNLAAFCVIFVCYTGIYIVVKSSAKRIKKSGKNQAEQIEFALRMAFLVGTDFVCWMPIIIMGFLSLTGTEVPAIVYVWIAVFVLPINSSLNPYLFTILTRELAKRQNKKDGTKNGTYNSTVNSSTERATTYADGGNHDSNLMKLASNQLQELHNDRLMPWMAAARIRSYQLSSYMKSNSNTFTTEEVNSFESDLMTALKYLKKRRYIHGKITNEFILIEKTVTGSRRAFLMMPDENAMTTSRSTATPDTPVDNSQQIDEGIRMDSLQDSDIDHRLIIEIIENLKNHTDI